MQPFQSNMEEHPAFKDYFIASQGLLPTVASTSLSTSDSKTGLICLSETGTSTS